MCMIIIPEIRRKAPTKGAFRIDTFDDLTNTWVRGDNPFINISDSHAYVNIFLRRKPCFILVEVVLFVSWLEINTFLPMRRRSFPLLQPQPSTNLPLPLRLRWTWLDDVSGSVLIHDIFSQLEPRSQVEGEGNQWFQAMLNQSNFEANFGRFGLGFEVVFWQEELGVFESGSESNFDPVQIGLTVRVEREGLLSSQAVYVYSRGGNRDYSRLHGTVLVCSKGYVFSSYYDHNIFFVARTCTEGKK